jgi:hypothetical protein
MESYWAPNVLIEGDPHPVQVRYERQRVTTLLKELGLADHAPALWQDFEEKWGVRRLTFESFDHVFPTFPWQLVAQSFYWTDSSNHWMTLKSWFARFDKTFIWKWYEKYLEYYRNIATRRAVLVEYIPHEQHGRPLGMIFPLQGIHGGMILHNGTPMTENPVFVINGHGPGEDENGEITCVPMRCYIELYIPWVKAVAKGGWTPDAPLTPSSWPAPEPEERQGAWIDPWMTQCCGGIGPDSLVLAWLCRVFLTDPPGGYERRFLGRDDGRRCVAATHAQIAQELPPHSERQIRTALSNLRKKGLIRTNQTCIQLVLKAVEQATDAYKIND